MSHHIVFSNIARATSVIKLAIMLSINDGLFRTTCKTMCFRCTDGPSLLSRFSLDGFAFTAFC